MEPKTLYKYRSDSKFTESIFTDSNIFLASPSSLNDPFDCKAAMFGNDYYKSYKENIRKQQIVGFVTPSIFGFQKDPLYKASLKRIKKAETTLQKINIINKYRMSRGLEKLEDASKTIDSIYEELERVGVFSLSEDPLNMLMWSHYGYNHCGICIGFERNEHNELGSQNCKKINYIDKFPEVNIEQGAKLKSTFFFNQQDEFQSHTRISFNDEQIQNVIYSKSKNWLYEKEWRFAIEKQGLYQLPGKITEVFFGIKSSEETQEKYIELCTEKVEGEVTFYQVIQEPNSFILNKEIITIHNTK